MIRPHSKVGSGHSISLVKLVILSGIGVLTMGGLLIEMRKSSAEKSAMAILKGKNRLGNGGAGASSRPTVQAGPFARIEEALDGH